MALSFEYGINTGNRFGQFIDHEEDPEEFIAQQIQADEKAKKGEKTKTPSASTKKSTTASSTTTSTGATGKSNKENVTGRSTGGEQRKPTNAPSNDNQQQQGAGRGRGGSYPRRGGSAGPDRGGRGGGNPRYNRAEGQQTGGFEQSADTWTGESGNDNQTFPGSRGRGGGRGRGNYEGGRGRGNYEGGRGFGRGRGEGRGEGGRGRGRGRGFNSNRSFNDAPQGQEQETSNWEQSAASNFDNRGPADAEIPFSAQGQNFESEQSGGRGGRGQYRSRTFRSNRHQGERSYHQERGDGEQQAGGQDEYRQNRRAHDRQPRNPISSVKPIEKKDGQGAHNWGDQTEVPEEEPVVTDEAAEGAAAPAAGAAAKDWAQRVDEEEQRLITFDEYKRQNEEKKKSALAKLPQFNRRTAGEGEDPKAWKAPEQVYRKKNEDDATDEEDEEGVESQGEEVASEDEGDEQQVGKKKIINIPLRFKPIETPRGSMGGRGGRRGAPRPSSDRPAAPRDEQGQGQASQQQQQAATAAPATTQPTGDEERPQSGYQRGGRGAGGPSSRGGAGRGEYRRSYGNAARGSRGGHQYSSGGKSADATNKFDFGNTDEFPTLAK